MKLSDENLNSHMNAIKAMIRRAHKNGTDTEDAERELCWLEREAEIREKRQAIHKEYVERFQKEQEEEMLAEKEALKAYEEECHYEE